MSKKLNKFISKLDINRDSPWGDWEANIYDPEPLSVKFLLKALISFIIILAVGVLIYIGSVYFIKYLEWTETLPQF